MVAQKSQRSPSLSRLVAELRDRAAALEQQVAALTALVDRYHRLAALTADFIFSGFVTADGHFELEWMTVVGAANEELDAQARGNYAPQVHEADRARVQASASQLFAGQGVDAELRVVLPEGERWLRVRARPGAAPPGAERVPVLAVARDITETEARFRTLTQQNEGFEKVVAVARTVHEPLALEETLRRTLSVAVTLAGADHGSLFLLDAAATVTHAILARGDMPPDQEQRLVARVMGGGLARWVTVNRVATLVRDTAQDPRWLALPDQPYTARSALAVPLLRDDALLGILTLTHAQPGHFRAEQMDWIQVAADQMALALDNARLYASVQAELAERRRAEVSLRETAERLELICHTTNDGVWEWNLRTDELYLSDRLLAILGTARADMRPGSAAFLDRIHLDDAAEVQRALRAHLREGAPFHVEFRIQRDDGFLVWVLGAGASIRDEAGRAVRVVGSMTDITERRLLQERLTHHAFHDSLTGLPNRALFMDRLEQALAYATRLGQRVAVLFLDLNGFKLVNDTHGHATGDALLQAVAARLLGAVRQSDTVARLAGDEFALVVPHLASEADAIHVTQLLQAALADPFHLGGHEIAAAASVGISVFPRDGTSAAELLERADRAMYHAKQGQHRYAIYGVDVGRDREPQGAREAELRRALDGGEFHLFFQPTIFLSDGQPGCVEALLRWCHPVSGWRLPIAFLSLAEASGMMGPLGSWVFREACQQALVWPARGPVRVSVNLSARQLADRALFASIQQALDESGLAPTALQLEIPEKVLLREGDEILPTLLRLRGLGVRLAVDDFGASLADASYLKRFPVETIKLDRRLVNGLGQATDETTLTATAIFLGHRLNLTVIAKSVELLHQRDHLRALGCDGGQGTLIAPPMPAADLAAWLAARRPSSTPQPPP